MANTIKIKSSGLAGNTPASLEYGEIALNYADGKIFYKNNSNTIVQFVGQKGDTGNTGAGGALGYWGSFWSTQDQTAAATGTEYLITLNNTDTASNGISIVSNNRITFAYAGVYSITYSIQWVNSGAQIEDVNVWLKKNGTNVDDSDSKWSVVASHGGIDGHAIGTVNYVVNLSANDYLQLAWQTTSTNVSLQYIPAASPAPSIPSIIVTAVQVMYTQIPSNIPINDLSDVVISNVATTDFLKYNGSAWVNDQIDLGTDTTGNYVASLVAGSGITITNNSGEGATPTVALTSNSVTVNGTSIALGASGTVTANAQTLTGTSLNSTVVGSSLTSVGNVTSGTWSAGTIAIAYGGTGATDAANARTNLGLAIGTNVQAYSATLAAVAGGTYTGATSITTVGTLTSGTWTANTVGVQYGGTGVTTITSNGVLYGNGTGAIANTGAGTAGYVLTAGTGGVPTWTANTGTGNVVRATSPSITTSITTANTSFDLINTTATTLNIGGGASTAVNIGNTSGIVYINASKLSITNSSGDEGGEIFLSNSVTNTTINTGVTMDVYQNRLRFFEQGGNVRGYYLDITSGGNGVGSAILYSGIASPSFTTSITTGSTTFALINTTATTINFGGAATTINIGASGASTSFNGTITSTGAIKSSGRFDADDSLSFWTARNNAGTVLFRSPTGTAVYDNVISTRAVYINAGGTLGTTSSTIRRKTQVSNYSFDTQAVLNLQPVKFKYKKEHIDENEPQNWEYGFIAEQALEVGISELVGFDDDGIPNYFAYERLCVAQQQVIRELWSKVETLENEVNILKQS